MKTNDIIAQGTKGITSWRILLDGEDTHRYWCQTNVTDRKGDSYRVTRGFSIPYGKFIDAESRDKAAIRYAKRKLI